MNDSLKNRVSQHFLFNSLNSVASLCRKNPEAAAELVIEISAYLQRSLEDKASFIALAEELEHVLSYINIQKARFQERLKISVDIDAGIQCLVPPFILQPLVDNAIRHGVLKRKQGGSVALSIKQLPDSIRITVTDNGTGMTREQLGLLLKRGNQRHSIYKIHRALKIAGGKGLVIKSVYQEGTEVMMEIPSSR